MRSYVLAVLLVAVVVGRTAESLARPGFMGTFRTRRINALNELIQYILRHMYIS